MTPGDSRRRNVTVILNGISLRKKLFYHKLFPLLRKVCNVEVAETRTRNEAILLASKAAEKYVDLILAAGGDGTLNQVVNGVLAGREKETKLPVIGLIPMGTGNDFARSAGIRMNADELLALIADFKPVKIDVGHIQYRAFGSGELKDRYFVNVADIGMGPAVVDKVLKSGRTFGHGAAYYKSILSTFFTYKPMVVSAVTPEWTWQGKLRTLAVANGKCYGNGLIIAPDAVLHDSMFSVFICGNVSVLDFIRHAPALKKGRTIFLPEVHYNKTTQVSLTSEEPCMIEGDGEMLGTLPARISLFPRQLDFLI